MSELDLTGRKGGGEPKPDGEPKGRGSRSERTGRRHRADMRERLFAIFERLAERLEGRGDAELAQVIRQDARAMVGGLDSAAKRVPGLASPILWALGILEPLLAFGRVMRILLDRFSQRRASRFEAEEEEPGLEEPGAWRPGE